MGKILLSNYLRGEYLQNIYYDKMVNRDVMVGNKTIKDVL